MSDARAPYLRIVPAEEPPRSDQPIPDGPFTPSTAARNGIGRAELDRFVRDGTVTRLVRGVYVSAATRLDQSGRAQALGLVIGRRQVVVGRTAAWLHGCTAEALLVGLPPGRGVPVELRPPGTRMRPGAVLEIGGIRTVTAEHSAADLARRLPDGAALAVLDALLRVGALSARDLLTAGSGADGVPAVLAARADGRADGPAESVLRLYWSQARLPTPSPAAVVGGGRMALALPTQRFGVVLAGRVGAEVRAGWRARGWQVLVLDGAQVLRTDPTIVGAHLEREFHQHLLVQTGTRNL